MINPNFKCVADFDPGLGLRPIRKGDLVRISISADSEPVIVHCNNGTNFRGAGLKIKSEILQSNFEQKLDSNPEDRAA